MWQRREGCEMKQRSSMVLTDCYSCNTSHLDVSLYIVRDHATRLRVEGVLHFHVKCKNTRWVEGTDSSLGYMMTLWSSVRAVVSGIEKVPLKVMTHGTHVDRTGEASAEDLKCIWLCWLPLVTKDLTNQHALEHVARDSAVQKHLSMWSLTTLQNPWRLKI